MEIFKYFKNRFSDAKPLEKPVGWNLPLGRIKRKSYGDGFMLLGDAAGLIDPFTGEGIGNAMVSAKYAIQVASQAKKMNNYSKSLLSKYERINPIIVPNPPPSKNASTTLKIRFLLEGSNGTAGLSNT